MRLLLLCLALPLAACGGAAASSDSGATSTGAAGTSLTVTYWADGANADQKTTTTFTGTVAAADLAPVPSGTPCTMIYGGPQKATVTGTIDGTSVDATFDRSNGCEIARWDKLAEAGVLPKA